MLEVFINNHSDKKIERNVYEVKITNMDCGAEMNFFGTIPMILKQVFDYDIVRGTSQLTNEKIIIEEFDIYEKFDFLDFFFFKNKKLMIKDTNNQVEMLRLYNGKEPKQYRLMEYIERIRVVRRL